jgi:hypothetical protein
MKVKCPYCNFEAEESGEMEAHVNNHVLFVKAGIRNIMLDYNNKVAFVHVVIGEGGNAKGVDVAIPIPPEKKVIGKAKLGGVTFQLLPDSELQQ